MRGQLRPENFERPPEVRAVHAVGRLVLVDRPFLGKDVGAAGGQERRTEAEESRREQPVLQDMPSHVSHPVAQGTAAESLPVAPVHHRTATRLPFGAGPTEDP